MKLSEVKWPTVKSSLLEKHGYIVIRDVFSEDEAEDFRERIKKTHDQKGPHGDLMSHPLLQSILLDDRIISIANKLLDDKAVYFGFSSYRYGTMESITNLHNDANGSPKNPHGKVYENPASTDWPIVRLGIYLQNHDRYSGGLKVRNHSHKQFLLNWLNVKSVLSPNGTMTLKSLPLGRLINLPSRKTDVVVFNMRTQHSGYFQRLRLLPRIALHPNIEKKLYETSLRSTLFIPSERDRCLIFADFGKPSEKLNWYITDRALYYMNIDHWQHTAFHYPENVAKLKNKGIQVDTTAMELFRSKHKITQ